MMFDGILAGIEVVFSFQGILFVLIGVIVGTVIGMIPGLGPITAIAVMIPITYGMVPALALLLMAGVLLWCSVWGSGFVNLIKCTWYI
jgi:putative tricarboxylic transport membrane protein